MAENRDAQYPGADPQVRPDQAESGDVSPLIGPMGSGLPEPARPASSRTGRSVWFSTAIIAGVLVAVAGWGLFAKAASDLSGERAQVVSLRTDLSAAKTRADAAEETNTDLLLCAGSLRHLVEYLRTVQAQAQKAFTGGIYGSFGFTTGLAGGLGDVAEAGEGVIRQKCPEPPPP